MADHPTAFCRTFCARRSGSDEWVTSAGRWDDEADAAKAAADWMLWRLTDHGEVWAVEVITVEELILRDD